MNIKEIIKSATADYKIQLTENQLEQLEKYFKLLVEWNEKINLTAITDEQGVAVKHFADSLSLFNYVDIPENSTIIDVGTGAGFPGIVLKIARPDIRLTLLDSLQKRLNFLDTVLSELSLDAVLIHSRAEDGGQDIDLRESFDFVVSRAVARLNVLAEYCIPYVRLSGNFIAMKGPDAENEIADGRKAVQTLGGKIKNIHTFSLALDGGERTIIEIEKIAPTPDKYPRSYGKIKAKPL
ncbi:16S rRNA (guanine(527)-N(7))-methyltransferase RsmG [Ruminococcus sp.]|uniref:16S rRNA (guanine(527)-N(7))-methyltransferase RsmG n=1 Tax=Ruminococcus sp. TaxID=41978 RepID=UPI00262000EB|nr:16S rRNA (guanine(527)-N(7))-methyltransferase RsmG [Ruminococcus sp.]MDD6988055.1 16S rRNA (guanine(527)-N(7))-methyltransferase RsmG [Ruminococcus sp.]MDY6202058.1 16S rRNA (guanine(527)-N(7))-methyltransferase RsmG [Ruminococcus sp.]